MLTLESIHRDTAISKYLDAYKQIQHHLKNIAPFLNQMESFERKEYTLIHAENIVLLNNLYRQIWDNKSLFNNILCKYGLDVYCFFVLYPNN